MVPSISPMSDIAKHPELLRLAATLLASPTIAISQGTLGKFGLNTEGPVGETLSSLVSRIPDRGDPSDNAILREALALGLRDLAEHVEVAESLLACARIFHQRLTAATPTQAEQYRSRIKHCVATVLSMENGQATPAHGRELLRSFHSVLGLTVEIPPGEPEPVDLFLGPTQAARFKAFLAAR